MRNATRIIFVTSEVTPFSKTGGLADVCGALPKALADLGERVAVFSPLYPSVEKVKKEKLIIKYVAPIIKVGERIKMTSVRNLQQSGVDFYFIEESEYFRREFLYGSEQGDYPDNAQRFIFFCKAVLESIIGLKIKPFVIHSHDWQTALIPLYLKTIYAHHPSFLKTKSVFTIHNLGYQGIFPQATFYDIGIPEKYFTQEGLEFYGKVNFLKAGLLFADKLTTVSPTYAKEIQTKDFGFGLEGVLAKRQADLSGILNGIDYSIWHPAEDRYIKPNYDLKTIEAKAKIKAKVLKKLNLDLPISAPLISFIGRLTIQKGIELIIEAIKAGLLDNAGLIILGMGEEKYHKSLLSLQEQFKKKISVNLSFNEPLAHQIYAGSDIFLIPSRYEPCGLGQMIALKYGTIPIGFKTGGLKDTIIDYAENPKAGNGFLFTSYNAKSFIEKIKSAIQIYQEKEEWLKIVERAMSADFSWDKRAQEYLRLYHKLSPTTSQD
jgi:starch synthase|uniref:Glycogen synthase n=1 Tax=candidate division WOR-3 bacterium TaxID=2052148 RepID=A0A7C6A9J3_UNCW3